MLGTRRVRCPARLRSPSPAFPTLPRTYSRLCSRIGPKSLGKILDGSATRHIDVLLLDVREEEDWDACRIEGSMLYQARR